MKRLYRTQLIEIVVDSLRPADPYDLPMIRQAVNDTADGYRKDGYTVPDFAQDRIVSDIQKRLLNK